MARKPTGKPLTLFPIRVDEDVKAALVAFKVKGTINEGLREALGVDHAAQLEAMKSMPFFEEDRKPHKKSYVPIPKPGKK